MYHMLKFLLDLRNSRSKINADIQSFRERIAEDRLSLAPWSREELELLSANHIDQKKSRKLDQEVSGKITNIYHEPVVSYAYKQYISGNRKSILIASTSEEEYIYKMEGDKSFLFINEERVGFIDGTGWLYTTRKKKIAHMDIHDGLSLLPITIQDKNVAGFNNQTTGNAVNNRAVQIYTDITPQEQSLVLGFVIQELIMNNID